MRAALDQVLRGHEPYPAMIVDTYGDLVSANAAFGRMTAGVADALLAAPVSVPRLFLHRTGWHRGSTASATADRTIACTPWSRSSGPWCRSGGSGRTASAFAVPLRLKSEASELRC